MNFVDTGTAARFEGRVAVVTGGGSGIGEATVRRLAAEGAHVVIVDSNAPAGKRVADAVNDGKVPGTAEAVELDITDWPAVQAAASDISTRHDRLDVLVNCAGIGAFGTVAEVAFDDWKRTLDVTLNGVFHCSRAFVPEMVRRGGGAIVNIGSTAGLRGDYGLPAYNAAKGAVVNLSRSMAIDHIRDGIRVNCVCPGIVETPQSEKLRRIDGYWDAIIEQYPTRRALEPGEVAAVVLFLASDDASGMVGATVLVDGGLSSWTGQPERPPAPAALTGS
ncbi:SDR family NAD(P)-dependent oxidoreductase [Streptomyces cadmiisoli]|uniref:SDR family NAD(P)-dependent oxidoreductase n=1 Tax=Streptomyces cadmiisoli TaxID=2184053 RepID=UPI00364FFB10